MATRRSKLLIGLTFIGTLAAFTGVGAAQLPSAGIVRGGRWRSCGLYDHPRLVLPFRGRMIGPNGKTLTATGGYADGAAPQPCDESTLIPMELIVTGPSGVFQGWCIAGRTAQDVGAHIHLDCHYEPSFVTFAIDVQTIAGSSGYYGDPANGDYHENFFGTYQISD